MRKIRFIVDSTFGVRDEYLKKYDIVVNPLNVIIDGKSYLDNVDISLYEVMDSVEDGKKVSTSRPTPESFSEIYNRLFEEGAEQIFCFTISSVLSGTVQSAIIARNEHFRKEDIFVYDTEAVHIYANMLLETAIRAVENGKRGQDVLDVVKTNWDEGGVLLSLQTLDVLFRSGRLSRFKTIVGNLLHVKPIVLYKNTKLEVIKKVRKESQVFSFCVDYIKKLRSETEGKLRIRITHVNAIERARALQKYMKSAFPDVEVGIGLEITSVLAIHIAYGGIGVGWIFDRV